ncbi:MAG: hypothetical protein RL172_863 [Bacteroidota bacterium]
MPTTAFTLVLKNAVTAEEKATAIRFLQQHNLPVTDITDATLLYLLLHNDTAIGTAGLEIFEDCALLRSVSVHNDAQGKGYGKWIADTIAQYATQKGINCLYLLTTTAKDFFSKQGYKVINRTDAPEAIRLSSEFASVCPASAVLMKKTI